MLRVRRDDRVMVIAGKDKGKVGKVMKVFPQNNTVLVEKINIVKKGQRKTQQNPQGGIISLEAPLHISNVMLVEKTTEKPTRFAASVLKDGSKVRVSKTTKETV
jgi:large subunit ribosomal protein L24